MSNQTVWYKVLENPEELKEARVQTVIAGTKGICLTRYKGKVSALDNRCPHQGGPLGEGSIENGLLRCPWHGWDYHPCTGKAPGFDDGVKTFPVEVKDDGIFVGLPKIPPHETTVSDIMAETMVNAGVSHVFGMVGHSNLGLADALRRQEAKGKLTYIGIRHEGAASFAASAYGKLTGKPAACFAIAGPGATNLYTGLWDAKNDEAPIIALTGQVQTQIVGTGAFQELDLVNAFASVASFNQRVLSNSKHAELMTLAFKHAVLNRAVSHLTFPDEVQTVKADKKAKAAMPKNRIASFKINPPKEVSEKAIDLLKKAKRPVIIMGHGAKFDTDKVIALAESLNAPVLTTFKGKGLIPDNHPLGSGVLGRSGTPIASWFMNEADVLCVFGSSFANHTGITPKIPTIQVDFNNMTLAKFHEVAVPVWGEIGVTAQLFYDAVKDNNQAIDQRDEVKKRWAIWKAEKASRLKDNRGKGVSSIAVFDAMNRFVPEDAVLTIDVGNHAYSFGRYYETKSHNSVLMSGYMGSIGFGYPAAMGAWAAAPNRPIFAVTGDGGFCQYLAEITTAVKYNMPIKHILLNNNELGKISKEQRAGQFPVWQTSLINPNFSDYANNCGALGIRVTQKEQLDDAMEKILAHKGPAMLEVVTDVGLI